MFLVLLITEFHHGFLVLVYGLIVFFVMAY